jgi:endonuclease/exonuclease/phosphatase family metal-dependent hydrolase
VDFDWPFRGIDHVLVRCGGSGPTLVVRDCRRIFDTELTIASEHYGLVVDLEPPPDAG